ncbi:hypothetical protein CQJ30_16365 [Caldibacillus thermoamylovorans]|nr:hypothetical protein CQJ30_16365 [Caldibacillus thermoamylovorans]
MEKNSHFIFIKFKNLEEKAKNEIINFPEPRSRVYFLFWQRLLIKGICVLTDRGALSPYRKKILFPIAKQQKSLVVYRKKSKKSFATMAICLPKEVRKSFATKKLFA